MQEIQETWVRSLGWEDPLEEKMTMNYCILAWKILCTEELMDYNPLVCRVGHD